MNSWYLDNTFLPRELHVIQKAIRIIEEETPRIVLHLRKEKCHSYITRPDIMDITDSNVEEVDSDIPAAPSGTLTRLGGPVGIVTFQKDHLFAKGDLIGKLVKKLYLLQDSQLQLTLVKACYGLPKFLHSKNDT